MVKYLLGIDAGFAHTGLSLFRVGPKEFKFIKCMTVSSEKAKKKKQVRVADDDADRIKTVILGMMDFIKPHRLDKIMIAVELPSGGAKGARANRTMGIITGAIVTFITMLDYPVEFITPTDVKVAVSGKTSASKDEIMDKIRKALGKYEKLLPQTKADFEHVADSIGVCLHIKRHSSLFRVFIQN